ncbi:hypothetical protein G6O67_008869 [Ophiocordyceps sinensis]|uniref:Velvet domain-containing protein n=1 Tax=Ophiocordyceps sinensis TaxID=72228 RepID=A0A8H4LPI1_9HYPO|nr:hypothetical protein G6O67_008869 [Ophiocordyceps sinensis]
MGALALGQAVMNQSRMSPSAVDIEPRGHGAFEDMSPPYEGGRPTAKGTSFTAMAWVTTRATTWATTSITLSAITTVPTALPQLTSTVMLRALRCQNLAPHRPSSKSDAKASTHLVDSDSTGRRRDAHPRLRQQPKAARACGFGDRDRRVIDPPPIVQLIVESSSMTEDEVHSYLRYESYVMNCAIWRRVGHS